MSSPLVPLSIRTWDSSTFPILHKLIHTIPSQRNYALGLSAALGSHQMRVLMKVTGHVHHTMQVKMILARLYAGLAGGLVMLWPRLFQTQGELWDPRWASLRRWKQWKWRCVWDGNRLGRMELCCDKFLWKKVFFDCCNLCQPGLTSPGFRYLPPLVNSGSPFSRPQIQVSYISSPANYNRTPNSLFHSSNAPSP